MRPKIYACYSDSHLPLVEQHFIPSLPDGFDLRLRHVPQSCPRATYNAEGWGLAMQHKVSMILDAIAAEKDPFVVSDVDVRFYDFQSEEVGRQALSFDASYQLDMPIAPSRLPRYCAGFVILAPSPLTRELYEKTLLAIPRYNTEQEALYAAMTDLVKKGLRVTHLPPDRFWCLKHGSPGPSLAIDHASWVYGKDVVAVKLDHLRETLDLYRGLHSTR